MVDILPYKDSIHTRDFALDIFAYVSRGKDDGKVSKEVRANLSKVETLYHYTVHKIAAFGAVAKLGDTYRELDKVEVLQSLKAFRVCMDEGVLLDVKDYSIFIMFMRYTKGFFSPRVKGAKKVIRPVVYSWHKWSEFRLASKRAAETFRQHALAKTESPL